MRADQSWEILLPRTRVYRSDCDLRGTTLTCLVGRVWITLSGDPTDHLLSSGESFAVTRRGVVVMEGLPEARIRLTSSAHDLGRARGVTSHPSAGTSCPWGYQSPEPLP